MNVLHLSFSDSTGGAARAALRIHESMRRLGVHSRMRVCEKLTAYDHVIGPVHQRERNRVKLRRFVGTQLARLSRPEYPTFQSLALFRSSWPKVINESDLDLVHLHWIGGEMLSIADIGRIRKPIIWTLHDMWAFCGAEHVTRDSRWKDGYRSGNRPTADRGFDLNRWTWKRKLAHWRTPIHVVTPSRWLAAVARESVIMRDWPIRVIPNPLDPMVWRPVDKSTARHILGLPRDEPLVAFGALSAVGSALKGFDLLETALENLRSELPSLNLLIFGQTDFDRPRIQGVNFHFMGRLHDEIALRLVYSAADLVVVPSRVEAFGQTGSEANMCGTPVVAFDKTGLADVVVHRETGYLATPFDPLSLAEGVRWLLEDSERLAKLSILSRENAVSRWSYEAVANQYLCAYKAALGLTQGASQKM